MTEDIKKELDAELPQGHVPITFDTDAAIAAGQRTAKRRTMWVAGGSTMSVIAIVALAATILTPIMGEDEQTAGSPQTATEPSVELDPDKQYIWAPDGNGGITQETSPYLEAFREHMKTHFPDAEVGSPRDDTTTTLTEATEDEAAFVRQDMHLIDMDANDGSVFDRTAFVLKQNHSGGGGQPQAGESEGLFLRFDGDEGDFDEQLNVVAVPAGTFTLDTADAIDLAGCNNDASSTDYHSCAAQEATGPNGETMREVTMELKDNGQSAVEAGRAVALKRDDGSGLVVSDETLGAEEDAPGPSLDFDQLADIALALPESPIE